MAAIIGGVITDILIGFAALLIFAPVVVVIVVVRKSRKTNP